MDTHTGTPAIAIEHKNVPRTTLARQQASLNAHSLELDHRLAEKVIQGPWDTDVEEQGGGGGGDDGTVHPEKTVLYLAYGSNMDTRTFSRIRGIKLVSLVNVYVPELELTFDLAGMPYREPCFATARYRRVHGPGEDKDSDGEKDALLSFSGGDRDDGVDSRGHWNKPLIGVVYEITARDYAWMIATESGGRGYHDRIVTCYPFPESYDPADQVPDHPATRPFKAHSLLSLLADHNDEDVPFNPRIRPNPFYAQPSRRYRDVVHSGAVESGLPFAYRDYLLQIHAFEATTSRQRIGKKIFLTLWLPLILLVEYFTLTYARPTGYSPRWVAVFSSVIYTLMWKSYDWLFFRVFGDGERTIGDSYGG